MRCPPDLDADEGLAEMTRLMTTDVPYNAKVTIDNTCSGYGYCMAVPA